jgi:hypothetical protein
VNPTAHTAKPAAVPETGRFASLGGLHRAPGSGVSARGPIAAPFVARSLVVLCMLAATLLLCAAPALAAVTEAPETTAATNVTATTAVLNGILNPHSRALTGWIFEYQPNPSSSSERCQTNPQGRQTTPLEPEAEVEALPVRAEVTGLAPDTQYTFCLTPIPLVSSGSGILKGSELHFTTRAVAPPPFGSLGQFSEQLNGPLGVGVDQATGGDVFVADWGNQRVDRFNGSGVFLEAWGWGVNQAAPAAALQTCTTSCQQGSVGSGAGQFGFGDPQGLAVDNEPLSLSYGDVYVVDSENFRVEKFSSSGEFLLMFGGGVNETSGANVCAAGERCRAGTPGVADGQFEWASRAGVIAVGPGGAVYIGDTARVQVFSPSGAWRENISLAGLSSTGTVTALAVDSAGDVFVKDGGNRFTGEGAVAGVREFAPNGTEKAQFETGSTTVEALATDPAGDLFVGDAGGGFHVLKYDAAGQELASFASRTVVGTTGMAFSESAGAPGELYVSDIALSDVWILPVPAPGPLVEPEREFATPGRRGAATLEASVNPEGSATSYHFEYVDQAHFQGSGYASASSTAPVAIGSSFEDQSATAVLTGLLPGGSYHYRVLATSSMGTATGPDQVFEEVPSALVRGPWATDVSSTGATLNASIDPLGVSTEYRLEYGSSTAYGQTLSGSLGEGEGYVPVEGHLQGLAPAATYHYRVVTVSVAGTVLGADRSFTTELAGGQASSLPDGRSWELVSPANKNGALIEEFNAGRIQAASDGSAITYDANEAVGEGTLGKTFISQILSTRVPGGWRTQDIAPPHPYGKEEEIETYGFEYQQFSPDLSLAALQERGRGSAPLSPEAPEGRVYLRNDLNGSYRALLTPANVPPGTEIDGGPHEIIRPGFPVELNAGTPDLSHVILKSWLVLTPQALEGGSQGPPNLYEWSAGKLQLVSILPAEGTQPGKAVLGAELGGEHGGGSVPRSLSDDGRWVSWNLGEATERTSQLYVRDMVAGKTVRIGGNRASYQTMSSDGSRIFFLEGGELFEFDTATGTQTDLTAGHGAGEKHAGVQSNVVAASEDGSYVYFIATGVLAGTSGAGAGEDNLYLAQVTGGAWKLRYVTTLDTGDARDWNSESNNRFNLEGVRSRVSPGGRFLEFMSSRSLTGYDNLDAVSGQPDEEVYLYDALAGRLVCASCDPSGARPVGVFDKGNNLLMDRNITPTATWEGRWLAGMVRGWDAGGLAGSSRYQPRFLSDSGRLFFDSTDPLVPQDTNGLMDAYQYEPAGVGGCTSVSATFSVRAGGCVDLISSGTSNEESAFFEASENGDDVFFLTSARLTGEDYDNAVDVYDAHVCSVALPCHAAPVSPPPCTSGDSCKAAPALQPAIFGAPASATFSGAGNVPPAVSKPAPRCRKGFTRKHNKCVKKRKSKRAGARKPRNHRRAKR